MFWQFLNLNDHLAVIQTRFKQKVCHITTVFSLMFDSAGCKREV